MRNLCNKEFAKLNNFQIKMYIVYGLVWLVWSVLPLSYLLQGFAESKIPPTSLKLLQGFAESLQHDSSNQSEIVMIKLYCCGPDYCSRCPLLYYFFQIRNGLGSSVFKLCCKDSAKPCMIKLYCCGPDYCSIYPLLYYFFQIRHQGSIQDFLLGGGNIFIECAETDV